MPTTTHGVLKKWLVPPRVAKRRRRRRRRRRRCRTGRRRRRTRRRQKSWGAPRPVGVAGRSPNSWPKMRDLRERQSTRASWRHRGAAPLRARGALPEEAARLRTARGGAPPRGLKKGAAPTSEGRGAEARLGSREVFFFFFFMFEQPLGAGVRPRSSGL
ncbi:unnamed protein product [Prorocentrum cordatum]|uniref:Uncharacterized protein n=1 Tax=Prorocentrum cordatum TaxID=2364126 RepID=A0ABN9XC61_9DINO|nr:unnamed protein product [Polarella glacialis]